MALTKIENVRMKRDLYWDSLKFLLIFLVVYGHVIEPYAPDGSYNRAMYSFIYMFHMPLFVFISGRFSQIRDREKYKKSIIRLIETYVIFQIIRKTLPLAFGKSFSWFHLLVSPDWILWYLAALIVWRFMLLNIPNTIIEKRKACMIVCIMLSLAIGFLPTGEVLRRILGFLPFFMLGYYSVDYDIRRLMGKITPPQLQYVLS